MNRADGATLASEQNVGWHLGMQEILFGMLDPLVAKRQINRILDAGCGTGYLAKLLEQRYQAPAFAVDSEQPGLSYARRMNRRRLAQCDVRELPFRPNSFDLVLSMDVVAGLAPGEELRAFAELSRVLARHGLLAVRVAAFDHLHSLPSELAHERQRFTKTRLRHAVEAQGLYIVRCTYVNTLPAPVVDAPWLERALNAPLALEAKLLKAGWSLPFGQSLMLIAEKSGT
ncbi:MAG: class I SAM-dependent methyltransferase [Acidobacteriaceae bacterium]|nr:class I SAM-dependent methyltransferase [Acidobacteriaceae bacterium]